MNIKMVRIDDIIPYEKNAKKHPDEQVEHIANSIREFGWQQPLVVDKDNVLVIGHGRLLAAKRLGMKEVPVVMADQLSEQQIMALRLADNKTNESEWDFGLLDMELEDISDIDMEQFGFVFESDDEKEIGSLAEKFLVPPFSVIYGNRPEWIERKHRWIDFGIKSEIGRDDGLVYQFPEWMGRQTSYKGGAKVK